MRTKLLEMLQKPLIVNDYEFKVEILNLLGFYDSLPRGLSEATKRIIMYHRINEIDLNEKELYFLD